MDKDSKKIKEAKKANVPVVSADYLEAVKTEGSLAALSKHSLVSWGLKKVSGPKPTCISILGFIVYHEWPYLLFLFLRLKIKKENVLPQTL